MDITKVVADHFILLVELVGLWGMLDIGVHIHGENVKRIKAVILLILLEAILWSIEQWMHSFETLNLLRPFLTATIYLIYPIIMVIITRITGMTNRLMWWMVIPILISAAILYTSQWTHWIFWISEDNLFHIVDNPLKFYPYYLFGFYIVVFLILLSKRYAKISRRDRLGIIWSICVGAFGVLINMIVDETVDYSTLLASVLVLYYLFMYMKTSKEDPLTGLLNRQCYYADCEKKKERISGVVSIDMNDLKKINDNQGHAAGDMALRTVAQCLYKGAGKGKNIYRIGGDEFVILYFKKSEKMILEDIEDMKKLLAQTDYVCAFGYHMIEQGISIDDAMKEADREMYANKAIIKGINEKRIAEFKEATIRVMHEALHSGMWGMDFDHDGNMCSVTWSPQFRKMLGYNDESEFPNKLESWSERLHPDDHDIVLKEFNDTIQDYTNQKTYDVKYRMKIKDGSYRKFHAIGRLLRQDNGLPLS
ncbi:MAG: diguanylate cyclase [Lachnospiraceae bacterium]|nr:diguanylate cyclase [Lachnospiraceae bacterium]